MSAALPLTNISAQEALDYAAWLTETTGFSYRLPTVAEWAYAAEAPGTPEPRRNYNCQIRGDSGLVKGINLEDVRTGAASPTRTYFPLWYAVGDRTAPRISGGARTPTAGLFSSDVVPEMQEYERTETTVVNSYVRPEVARYVNNLQSALAERLGDDAQLSILRSDGDSGRKVRLRSIQPSMAASICPSTPPPGAERKDRSCSCISGTATRRSPWRSLRAPTPGRRAM